MSYLVLDDHMLEADPRVRVIGIKSTVEYIAAKRDCCIFMQFQRMMSTKLKNRNAAHKSTLSDNQSKLRNAVAYP